jgi:transposase
MGKKRDLPDFLKGKINALINEGYSQRQVASRLNISRGAVRNVISSNGSSNRRNCGRKRKTTLREDRLLKGAVVRSPHASSARLAHESRQRGCNISSRTVRRRLSKDFNLVARRPAKKPMMTRAQLRARLRFCKIHKDKPADWWDKVMFSDESTFQQVRGSGTNYVRRPVGKRLDPKYTIKTVKHPPSVMVWGAIAASGRCGLKIFDKGVKVNAEEYIKVMESKVSVHMQISNTTLFQQDSAPCHTARSVKKWFADNGIDLLADWPSNSPDLNVIENCWNLMKKKVAEHHPTSETDLKKVLLQVWTTEISPDYCKTLVRSMPSRIQAVMKNRGYPVGY